jgi:hypothetical protein
MMDHAAEGVNLHPLRSVVSDHMPRPQIFAFWLSLLLLGSMSLPSPAQSPQRARDSSTVAREDSVKQEGRSWLTSLLRKIARKSDDSSAVAATLVDSAATEPEPIAVASTATARAFKSRKDSVQWSGARNVALHADGYRIVVDIFAHELYVIGANDDTLRKASAATATNATLTYGGRNWSFETPRGVRTVLSKDKDPVWRPPDWHFAEVALEHNLKLRSLQRGQVIRLRDGTRLKIEGDEVGIIAPGTKEFQPLVLDMHVVFDNTLFVPPVDTKHRQIEGELGHFRLYLGDGYQIHGTPYANSIGASVTHGCVRLHDDDIEWLYDNVPVGTKVYIY